MNINWKVRFKNKAFWLGFIPAVLILIQTICALFGVDIQIAGIEDKLINIVEALFVVLAILGVVVDPTTAGVSDGYYGLQYTAPGVVEKTEDEDDFEVEEVK